MLFDNESGKAVPKGVQEDTFNIKHFATRNAKGQIQISHTGPPVDNGEPAEVYSGPGSTLGKAVSDWEPIGGADVYNLRRLRVTSLAKFDGGGFGI